MVSIKSVFFIAVFLPLVVMSQEIQFERELNWEQLKEKAAKERKYIFVDCYTTWCAPCKRMAKGVFTQAEVGKYFNEHFINVSAQMDRTGKDPEEIRNWYNDAKAIAATYHVEEYPTYLFFSPNGEIVHRASGATNNGTEFIGIAKAALNPDEQCYTLIRKCKEYGGDSAFLRRALDAAANIGDYENIVTIGNNYIECLKNPLSKENIAVIDKYKLIKSSHDKCFKLFEQNATSIDSLMEDKAFAEWALSEAIYREKIDPLYSHVPCVLNWRVIASELHQNYPKLGSVLIDIEESEFRYRMKQEIKGIVYKTGAGAPHWKTISKNLKNKYPDYDFAKILLDVKASYHYDKGEWAACERSAYLLMHRYGRSIGDMDINNIAWDYIFMHGRTRRALHEALVWMKISVERDPERGINLDTYANLLYKEGHQIEAMFWENRAIKKTQDAKDLKAIRANLDKIEKSQPTWASNATLISG